MPHWVALSCYVAIGLGTLTGGWRIIETMGTRITKLDQHQGFSASAGGSVMLFAASYLGIPVSTTHTITGCVIGAGAARRASAVRWGVARQRDDRVDHHHPRLGDRRRRLFYWLITADLPHFGFAALIIVALAVAARAWRRNRVQPRGV